MARRETYAQGWTLYPWSALGHHAQGAACAGAVLFGTPPVVAAALGWGALYVAYQGLSVLRKSDSPGLDIVDFMAGAGLGIGVSAVATWWV